MMIYEDLQLHVKWKSVKNSPDSQTPIVFSSNPQIPIWELDYQMKMNFILQMGRYCEA